MFLHKLPCVICQTQKFQTPHDIPQTDEVFITLARRKGKSILYHHLCYNGIPDFKQFLRDCYTRFKVGGIAQMYFDDFSIETESDWVYILNKCHLKPVIDVKMKVAFVFSKTLC